VLMRHREKGSGTYRKRFRDFAQKEDLTN